MKNICLAFMLICGTLFLSAQNISNEITQRVIANISKNSQIPKDLVTKGVNQTAALWTAEDGTPEQFVQFCTDNFCKNATEKQQLFNRLCQNFESILGHNNRVIIDLSLPIHVTGYQQLPIDELFAAYNGLAHLNNDMFANKIAFIITLNFPHFTLAEKTQNAAKWNNNEWGYARLGDMFTSRIPAEIEQTITAATTAADNYISNYNIHMGEVVNREGQRLWTKNIKLISHWGLRDELKAAYADANHGLEKQQLIYTIMNRIISQSIPKEAINGSEYPWKPSSNKFVLPNGIEMIYGSEKNVRYQYLLNNFKAIQASDAYYPGNSTYLTRRFDDDLEISLPEVEKLFTTFLSCPEVATVADLISKKLGRKLEPFDIWYNGFKNRSSISEYDLDRITQKKYPTKEAFAEDLPNILQKLGFTKEKAEFICSHVTVDASVGAGHAWEALMRSDNARLRTRIGEKGMDYKGYNIGIHEFGHNVEQTFSLHNVPNYFLAGVPNTAFTEALAFTFQQRDLQLLGISAVDTISRYYDILDNFWSCYEIMGVALLDIHVWQWMYAHPDATADELKEAVIAMAKEIWNLYYAPVFKIKDQTILAIYSHMIDSPLYLPAYPIGYLISFQLENYFQNKNLGTEVERIFSQGKLIPQYWLQKAVGGKLNTTNFSRAAADAAQKVKAFEKAEKKNKKS